MTRPQAKHKSYSRQIGVELIPGYRLIAPLGRGAFGEVWKCQVPGGLKKAIKIVGGPTPGQAGLNPATAQQELEALERMKAIRHPFLLSIERLEVVNGELLIVMELADKSLHDRFKECQAEGRPGIPREQLLPLLREAAEALDLLNTEYDLQHLDVKPHNLFLVGNHVKVADFGLVQSLRQGKDGDARSLGTVTPLYGSPEVLQGGISRSSDQYSLAIVYQELLTGTTPFTGKNAQQLMRMHMLAQPNLEPLPAPDRAVIARALSKDPGQRFPSCQALVASLTAASAQLTRMSWGASAHSSGAIALSGLVRRSVIAAAAAAVAPAVDPLAATPRPDETLAPIVPPALLAGQDAATEAVPSCEQYLLDLIQTTVAAPEVLQHGPLRYLLDSSGTLEHRCVIGSVPALIRLKLDGFSQEWEAQRVRQDERTCVYRVAGAPTFWDRCFGRPPAGLEIQIQLEPVLISAGPSSAATIRIRAYGRSAVGQELRVTGPRLFGSLLAYLRPLPEQRTHERFPFPHTIRIHPIFPGLEIADEVEAVGADLSLGGIRFRVAELPDCSRFYVTLTPDGTGRSYALLAEPVRVKQCPDGSYDIGARFIRDAGAKR